MERFRTPHRKSLRRYCRGLFRRLKVSSQHYHTAFWDVLDVCAGRTHAKEVALSEIACVSAFQDVAHLILRTPVPDSGLDGRKSACSKTATRVPKCAP